MNCSFRTFQTTFHVNIVILYINIVLWLHQQYYILQRSISILKNKWIKQNRKCREALNYLWYIIRTYLNHRVEVWKVWFIKQLFREKTCRISHFPVSLSTNELDERAPIDQWNLQLWLTTVLIKLDGNWTTTSLWWYINAYYLVDCSLQMN